MQNDVINKLVDLGIAFTVDGYSESVNELVKFETKYGISSRLFYDDYNNCEVKENITYDDIADWIFYCNIFLSSGGDLKKFEEAQKLQSYLESHEYINMILKSNKEIELKQCKRESEECRSPRFLLYRLA
jgi:hypothetical protein